MRIVADIEANGLPEEVTVIHCLSYHDLDTQENVTLYDYDEMRKLLLRRDLTIIGHNFVRYDKRVLEKILNIKIVARIIDTLTLSWYIEVDRDNHGLDGYGKEFGIQKPVITDWSVLSKQEYAWRCSEDVRINVKLWLGQDRFLRRLYGDEIELMEQFIDYLTFKMECVREQEELGLRLDVENVEKDLRILCLERDDKLEKLAEAMPKKADKYEKSRPKVMYKADGKLSKNGEEWFSVLKERGLADDTATIEIIRGYEKGNPKSHVQMKEWLFSLGWVPDNIKHERDKKTGKVKKIPQIGSKEKDGEVSPSVKKLIEKEPAIEHLSGLSVLNHRISLLEGFLENKVGDRLYPSCMGLTNTMRLQHAVVVNLPTVDKKYGKIIRGALIADEGRVLCGSDLSNIEDRTKRHYIYKYDPEYVKQMDTPGYDAHLDIATLAGLLTKEQVDEHKLYSKTGGKEGKSWSAIRHKAKTANFSCTYKVGAQTLSQTLNGTIKEAKLLIKTYWERNHAILKVEDECEVKIIDGKKWLKNLLNGWWYSLRADKDKFSTLNQGSAVYIMDLWIMYVREEGVRIPFQYHDEILFNIHPEEKERTKAILDRAMDKVNDRVKMNVKAGCGTQFADRYSDCH